MRDPVSYQRRLNTAVERALDQFKPDVLHCQHLCYGMTAALTRLRGIPKIGVCHGTDVIEACRNRKFRDSFRKNVRTLDRIIFPSRGILSDARTILPIPAEKVRIVPWGLPARYLRLERKLAQYCTEPFHILYAGRFDESKGIDLLIHALSALPEWVHLTLLGQGPIRSKLSNQIAQLDLEKRVRFKPWQNRDDLQETFAEYQLLVLPSREIEAFGLVSVEAQAAGLPAIVSRVSGLPETLPKRAGVLAFTSGDVHELVDRIGLILGDQMLWSDLAMRCRANANRFKIQDTVDQFMTVSRSLIHA
ncbi:MAG: glycosyltransferase family 4 protein [Litoreibacter sp.]|uniref:glycosyltransferase family 4 protein n=1 Tax=Litoreibacter sp. TaxID=1969459 RepID=UPI0032971F2B